MEKIIKFEATGTVWTVSVVFEGDIQRLEVELLSRIKLFEKRYSRFIKNSFVSEISTKAGNYTLTEEDKLLFDLYRAFEKLTSGAFTMFVGKALVEAGYDVDYSLSPKNLTPLKNWDYHFDYNFPELIVKKPTQVDFGAAGKGYLIDIISALLKSKGITDFSIDAGQDLYLESTKEPLKIGLEHPNDVSKIIGSIDIQKGSICSSSGNRRKWKNYHHIIHGENLESPKDILSVWTLAEKALLADALSTALFLVDPSAFLNKYTFEYLILYSDFSVVRSSGFSGELYYA